MRTNVVESCTLKYYFLNFNFLGRDFYRSKSSILLAVELLSRSTQFDVLIEIAVRYVDLLNWNTSVPDIKLRSTSKSVDLFLIAYFKRSSIYTWCKALDGYDQDLTRFYKIATKPTMFIYTYSTPLSYIAYMWMLIHIAGSNTIIRYGAYGLHLVYSFSVCSSMLLVWGGALGRSIGLWRLKWRMLRATRRGPLPKSWIRHWSYANIHTNDLAPKYNQYKREVNSFFRSLVQRPPQSGNRQLVSEGQRHIEDLAREASL